VRSGLHRATDLLFEAGEEQTWTEWQVRVWPLLVPVEQTDFEVSLLDHAGELIEVGGLSEAGFTLLNVAPPILHFGERVPFEP
jgi:hypothetical protein